MRKELFNRDHPLAKQVEPLLFDVMMNEAVPWQLRIRAAEIVAMTTPCIGNAGRFLDQFQDEAIQVQIARREAVELEKERYDRANRTSIPGDAAKYFREFAEMDAAKRAANPAE